MLQTWCMENVEKNTPTLFFDEIKALIYNDNFIFGNTLSKMHLVL